jgi:hypothetical protein
MLSTVAEIRPPQRISLGLRRACVVKQCACRTRSSSASSTRGSPRLSGYSGRHPRHAADAVNVFAQLCDADTFFARLPAHEVEGAKRLEITRA